MGFNPDENEICYRENPIIISNYMYRQVYFGTTLFGSKIKSSELFGK